MHLHRFSLVLIMLLFTSLFSRLAVAQEGLIHEEMFGSDVVTGDFNNDNFEDLAVAVMLDWDGSVRKVGGVHILYGWLGGLTESKKDQFLSPRLLGFIEFDFHVCFNFSN